MGYAGVIPEMGTNPIIVISAYIAVPARDPKSIGKAVGNRPFPSVFDLGVLSKVPTITSDVVERQKSFNSLIAAIAPLAVMPEYQFFSLLSVCFLFGFLLELKICPAIFRRHYLEIGSGRSWFGEFLFDPATFLLEGVYLSSEPCIFFFFPSVVFTHFNLLFF